MAVAYDVTGAGAHANSSPTNISWSHNCSGSDRVILAAVSFGLNSSQQPASPGDYTRVCNYGATPMTSLSVGSSNNTTAGWVELFGLLDPPIGSTTVTASATKDVGGTYPFSLIGNSVSFSGADDFGTPPTPTYAAAASLGITITSATDDYTLAVMCCGGTITSITHDQRSLIADGGDSAAGNQVIGTYPGAASVTFTGSGADDWWGAVGVSILAATGGGDTGSSLWLWNGESWVQSEITRIWDGDSWNEASDPTFV